MVTTEAVEAEERVAVAAAKADRVAVVHAQNQRTVWQRRRAAQTVAAEMQIATVTANRSSYQLAEEEVAASASHRPTVSIVPHPVVDYIQQHHNI